MQTEKRLLADELLRLLEARGKKKIDETDIWESLAELPEHPRKWNMAIVQSALSRFLGDKPTDSDLMKGKSNYLAKLVECYKSDKKRFVATDGTINFELLQELVPPPGVSGVTVGEIQKAFRSAGLLDKDPDTQKLVAVEVVREKNRVFTEVWKPQAKAIIDQHVAQWQSGVMEDEIMTLCKAETGRQIKQVRKWLKERGLRAVDKKWMSKERYEAHLWDRYLTHRGNTVEQVMQAWEALGLTGRPPLNGFYVSKDGMPVFEEEFSDHPFVTLGEAGLKGEPNDVQPVAIQKLAYLQEKLYRREDLQPHSSRLLVDPHQPVSAPRIHPGRRRFVTIHVGPTNSGKTHTALQRLTEAEAGLYLAPLRLMAWEAYERLNESGCPCDLLTGEESISVPGARVIAATVEMMPRTTADVVVIDEAQLIGDADRGWAWARAIALTNAQEMHVCCAPEALDFLSQLFAEWGDEVRVVEHERLVPLVAEPGPRTIQDLPVRSAVIAFSRRAVLRWKAAIEAAHPDTRCAVIYGALPPDVRREQTRMVLSGEAQYVVATDAIGMGLNLPLDHVYFAESEKFDGNDTRRLTPAEIRQIAGRAGRYGMATVGTFGGLGEGVHRAVVKAYQKAPSPIEQATWHPSFRDLSPWEPWRIGARLRAWKTTIAPVLPKSLRPSNLGTMLQLADLLPEEIERDNPERAFKLVTAPVSDHTLAYWVGAVKRKTVLHPPVPFRAEINDDDSLALAESSLHEYDLCLWLARHRLFSRLPDMEQVRKERNEIAKQIDAALKSGIAFCRCRVCGKPLSPTHPYRICDSCYTAQRSSWYWDDGWDEDEEWDEN